MPRKREFNPYMLQTVRDVLIRKYGILGAFEIADRELVRRMQMNPSPNWTPQSWYWWNIRQAIKGRLPQSSCGRPRAYSGRR